VGVRIPVKRDNADVYIYIYIYIVSAADLIVYLYTYSPSKTRISIIVSAVKSTFSTTRYLRPRRSWTRPPMMNQSACSFFLFFSFFFSFSFPGGKRAFDQVKSETYSINVMKPSKPTILMITLLSIRTNMPIHTIKIPTPTTQRTTPRARLERQSQLLTRTKLLAMIVITIAACLASASQVIVVADLFGAHAFKEACGCRLVAAGQGSVEAFVVGV
jgi:hypothetical protein